MIQIRNPKLEIRGKGALTPCFSGVSRATPTNVNRFNGFKSYRCSSYPTAKKPLKRLMVVARTPTTPLKQGVNDNGVLVKNLSCSPE